MKNQSKISLRRTSVAVALTALIGVTSACGTGPSTETKEDPKNAAPVVKEETRSPETNSPEPSTDQKHDHEHPESTIKHDETVAVKGLVKTSHGTYPQITLSENSDLLADAVAANKKANKKAKNDDDPETKPAPPIIKKKVKPNFTEQEIEAATDTILNFMVEEAIDSPLNGGAWSVDKWYSQHKDELSPKYRGEFLEALKADQPFVLQEPWQQDDYKNYHYIYSDTQTRVSNLEITPTDVWVVENNTSIALKAHVSFDMAVTPNVGLTGSGVQSTTGYLTYAVTQNHAGEWIINGFQNDVDTIEG